MLPIREGAVGTNREFSVDSKIDLLGTIVGIVPNTCKIKHMLTEKTFLQLLLILTSLGSILVYQLQAKMLRAIALEIKS